MTGPIPSPKVYCFYVGLLGVLFLVLAPFLGFYIPETWQIVLSLLAGALFIYGLFWFYKALRLFEASRVVPAIGGILPFFTFLLIYIFSKGKETFSFWEFSAFILLILGSILVTYEKGKKVSLKSLQISAVAAFFLALSFVLTKYVYMAQPFWSGYIWIKIGGALAAFAFLLTREVRSEVFKLVRTIFQKKEKPTGGIKIGGIFLGNQAVGAGANILQNWAIALAPLVCVAIVNALQGIQYVFLFVFAVLISLKFPQIIKEEISRRIIFQKIIAILLIGGGLAILAF